MKFGLLSLTLLAAFALPVSAQTSNETSASQAPTQSEPSSAASGASGHAGQQYGEGGSKRCDQLTGAEKQACLQDEGAKTDRAQEPAAAAPAAGATRESESSGDHSGTNATQTND